VTEVARSPLGPNQNERGEGNGRKSKSSLKQQRVLAYVGGVREGILQCHRMCRDHRHLHTESRQLLGSSVQGMLTLTRIGRSNLFWAAIFFVYPSADIHGPVDDYCQNQSAGAVQDRSKLDRSTAPSRPNAIFMSLASALIRSTSPGLRAVCI